MTFKEKNNSKVLYKRINRQLKANFFTIEEFKSLTNRKARKVIKYISDLENIKLSKTEISDIVNFIKFDFEEKNIVSTYKLWSFVINTVKHFFEKENEVYKEYKFSIKPYQVDRFEIMLN